jgi:hypothetical protein
VSRQEGLSLRDSGPVLATGDARPKSPIPASMPMGPLGKQMLPSHSAIGTRTNRASEIREPDNDGKVSSDEVLQAFGLPSPWTLPRHTVSPRSQACRSLQTLAGPGETLASSHSALSRRSFERAHRQ